MATKRKSDKVYPIFTKRVKTDVQDEMLDDKDAISKLLEFQQLLDFSTVEREDEISAQFDRIAAALLHEFRLVVKPAGNLEEIEFQVLEAEFYLRLEGCHEDPFTHGSEEQKISGNWYFHRAPRFSKDSHQSLTSSTEYRGGSRKGMDLTFGGPISPPSSEDASTSAKGTQCMGGILLRTIREVKSKKIISGPSLLVDRILVASGASSIEYLVQNKWAGNTSAFKSTADSEPSQTTTMYLKPVRRADVVPTIYFSPRIGLDLSHPGTTSATNLPLHPRIRFLPKRYRFFIYPELLTANGRPQTFLGVLQASISSSSSGLQKKGLSRDVARLTGVKESTSAKYLTDYISGRDGGVELLDSVIGAKGKGASSSPATYLKMLGAISNLNL